MFQYRRIDNRPIRQTKGNPMSTINFPHPSDPTRKPLFLVTSTTKSTA